MAFLEWEDKYSVGFEKIDSQHKKLIDLINELYDAMSSGKGKDVLGEVVSGLIDYTKVHFKTEEDSFDKFSYESTAAHKMEHKIFVDKVLDFESKFKDGKVFITVEILNFLKDWLVGHIDGTDKKYIKCFKENNF